MASNSEGSVVYVIIDMLFLIIVIDIIFIVNTQASCRRGTFCGRGPFSVVCPEGRIFSYQSTSRAAGPEGEAGSSRGTGSTGSNYRVRNSQGSNPSTIGPRTYAVAIPAATYSECWQSANVPTAAIEDEAQAV